MKRKEDLAELMAGKMKELMAQHKANGEKFNDCGHSNCISAMSYLIKVYDESMDEPIKEEDYDKGDSKLRKRSK